MAALEMKEQTGAQNGRPGIVSPAPHLRQRAQEMQKFGELTQYPLGLSHEARTYSVGVLNQALADSMVLRDLYKKHHWQLSGPTFYQLHLLFDKHYEEQVTLVDAIAERVQILGGISIAMPHDVAEITRIERVPRGREEVPVQISRLLEAHELILTHARPSGKRAGELGDLFISQVVRTHEMQVWFLTEHLVDVPLVRAK